AIPAVDRYVNSMIAQSISPAELEKLRIEGIQNIRDKMDERLQDFCEKELDGNEFPGGKPETYLLEGDAGTEILALADKLDADLIAMGARRHNRVGELLMGSVAYRITHRSKRPMLLVPIED
ncbi:MAG: universal stress protein, partial [Granulosicoccaceae bacterium]